MEPPENLTRTIENSRAGNRTTYVEKSVETGGDTITFTVRIEPGHPGFEKSLYILYGLANDGLVDEDGIPENIYHTAVFATLSDTGSSEVGSLMSWIIRRLAGRAQRMDIEDELIERYYLAMTEE